MAIGSKTDFSDNILSEMKYLCDGDEKNTKVAQGKTVKGKYISEPITTRLFYLITPLPHLLLSSISSTQTL
jgi:hypothetical protein